MTELLERFSGRHLALVVLAVFVCVIVAGSVLPWWLTNLAYQSRLETVSDKLQRLQYQARGDEKLKPRLEQLKQAQLTNGHYLKGGTEAVAAAELQSVVKAIAGRNESQIMSFQILPVAAEEYFVRVGLRVRMRGSLAAIIATLHELEAQEMFLFVNRLSIQQTARRGTPLRGVSDQFDSDFEVLGYMPEMTDG